MNKTKTEIFNMFFKTNLNIIFDERNMPVPQRKKQGKFGEYTMYTTASGYKTHYQKGCCNAYIPKSMIVISEFPCSKCKKYRKEPPITQSQHIQFVNLINELQHYNINIKQN